MSTLYDDGLVGPPTEPIVGPPIPGDSFGKVPKIVPDDIPQKVVTPEDAKSRALHRAIHNINRGPWGRGGY